MDDMTVVREWEEVKRLCVSIGWGCARVGNGNIAIGPRSRVGGNTARIVAHKTKSVTSALGFIQGFIAGTKEDR